MLIPLDILKLAQAAAVLLKEHAEHRMGRMRLLKLLYIADRQAIEHRARPITGDTVVAMEHGPVLTTTYSLIKGRDFNAPQWQEYFETRGRDVVLIRDPGVGKLSRREIAELQGVAQRFVGKSDSFVRHHTHGFAEWEKNKPTASGLNVIPLEDVLAATGRLALKETLLADAARQTKADAFFRSGAGE